MNMDEQPIDLLELEIAKRLKELKFIHPSQCYWISHGSPEKFYIGREGGFNKEYHPEHIPAYSTFELLELIPPTINTKNNEPFNFFRFCLHKLNTSNIRWIINYYCDTFDPENPISLKLFRHNICDEKLVNALGMTLINICENKWGK